MAKPVNMRVYANDDDALIIWSVPKAIPDCLGFAIERRTYDRTDPDLQTIKHTNMLPNRLGFVDDPHATAGRKRVSTVWPFQRFWWTDHDTDQEDIVSYRVIPMVGTPENLEKLESHASDWSPIRVLSAPPNSRFNAFFNRGLVISQFMARYLERKQQTPAQLKASIQANDEEFIRTFLYGYLGSALFTELRTAADEKGEIFAALYELEDHQLISLLCALGPRAHIVLANGSIQAKKGEKSTDARKRDQNHDARAELLAAEVDVSQTDRFLSPGALGHNKFFVRTDHDGKFVTVWTGSTNWTTTGLCTQLNNGLLIRDDAIATEYMEQWKRLRKAKSAFPDALKDANTNPKPFAAPPNAERMTFVPFDTPPPASSGSIWFTRTRGDVDTEALKAEIEAAEVGILFLMFMPGGKAILPTMQAAAANPNLYVRGVVSQLPAATKKQQPEAGDVMQVDVVKDAETERLTTNIVEPDTFENPVSQWALAEVTRGQFRGSIGQAIVHSKTIVIDPFSDHPVVITGSHNFSEPASKKNDENFLIIRDDPPLAEAYAVHIMAAYDHYRYRAAQQQKLGLSRTDDWMAAKLTADEQELRVWNVR